MLNINNYTEMTKENFIDYVNEEELCPNNFGLNDSEICDGGDKLTTCTNCWKCAIANMEFFNPLMAFQNNSLTILDDLCIVEKQYQQLDESRKSLKDKLMILMEQYGVDKFENDKISITYVKGSTGTTFDSAKFKKEHKDLYEAYQKPSIRAASIRFKVK